MIKRRGSAYYRAELARMFDQFKVGFLVAPTFHNSPGDSFKGVVTAVNRAENKVYVAWNSGAIKQHDPDEISICSTPVHITNAPADARKDVVLEQPSSHEEQKRNDAEVRENGPELNVGKMANKIEDIAGKIAGDIGKNKIAEKVAMYHGGTGRRYKRTRAEMNQNKSICPKCGEEMEMQPYTKSEKMIVCPECGWKISTGNVE